MNSSIQLKLTPLAAVSAARLPPKWSCSNSFIAAARGRLTRRVITHAPNRIAGAFRTRRMPSRHKVNMPMSSSGKSELYSLHTRKAQVIRKFGNQAIHFNEHFVAASVPLGASDFELLV